MPQEEAVPLSLGGRRTKIGCNSTKGAFCRWTSGHLTTSWAEGHKTDGRTLLNSSLEYW